MSFIVAGRQKGKGTLRCSLPSHPGHSKAEVRLQPAPGQKGDPGCQDLPEEIDNFLKFIKCQNNCEYKSNIDIIGYNDY